MDLDALRQAVQDADAARASAFVAWERAKRRAADALAQLKQAERDAAKQGGGTLSVAKVAAVLKKAGFPRSTSSTTAVRGWHDRSRGFRLVQRDPHTVVVRYEDGNYGRSGETADHYRGTLEAAGFTVTAERDALVVTPSSPENAP